MAELLYQHPHYQLLLNTQRRGWCPIDKTTFAIICIVTVPMLIFCTIYVLLFGVYETVVYPSNFNNFEVPNSWLNRAILYNEASFNATLLPQPKHNFRLPESNALPQNDYKLICYYNFPSDSNSDLYVFKIDPNICTHINVANADIVNNTISLSESYLKVLTSVIQLKKFNKDLKILLTITAFGNRNSFAQMVSNHTNRKTFIKSVLYYIRTYKIDGIDLDWEFPNDNESSDKHQVIHFTQLLAELRKTIERRPAKHQFLVSAAVAAPVVVADVSYDIGYMNSYVDYINLMTYDFHFFTKFTPFTGLNSPLYPLVSEKGYLTTLNINYSANFWQSKGMDKSKIMIGLPTYGHTFTLTNSKNNRIYSPASGYGRLGQNGFVDYNQVCTFLYANQIAPIFETDAKSPYATKSSEWISFEDEQSLLYKAEFIRDNHYGGAMVYSLNADDHKGLCKTNGRSNAVTFPLTRTVRNVLFNNKNT